MIGAEVEHRWEQEQEREPGWLPAPSSAPLRGYPADSSGPGYRHSAALACLPAELLGRRIRVLIRLTNAVAAE
jgi:hypothetical protein